MNGIAAFFARESVPNFNQILKPMCNAYLNFDNHCYINAVIIKSDHKVLEWDEDHNILLDTDGNYWKQFEDFYSDNMKIGDLIIFSIGAPLLYDENNKFVIASNSSNCRTFRDAKVSVIDYIDYLYVKNQRDMKRTLEECDQCDINIIASDIDKMNLMSANDGHAGIQMCHAYIKGIGFMLHQNMVCLRNIIHDFTDCSQDAVNLWETWYGHPLEAEVIRETDLESGSMRKIKFNPKWSY